MTVARGLFYVASVFLAGVILLGFYVFYRHTQTPDGAEFVRMFQRQNIAAIPPTACTSKASDFEGSRRANLFLNEGQILLETLLIRGNVSTPLRVVILQDGTYQFDPTARGAVPEEEDSKEIVDSIIAGTPWTCSTWWFPDETLFNVSS